MENKRFLVFVLFVCLGSWSYAQEGAEAAPMEKTELDALFSAIQGFVGNSWNGSDLYPDPCGWTPIQGVSCDIFDGLWYVTALSIGPTHENSLACAPNAHFRQQLSNAGLTGKIPASLGSLPNLQSLILLQNGLVGEIPESFGDLIRLKRLVLSGNSLTGPIAPNLGRLSELLILDLSRNFLSGSLPPCLGNLSSLLKLDLSDNKLGGVLPDEIGDMRSLTLLDLSNNSFYGGLRRSFEKMNSLEEIILSNNPIGGELKNINWKTLRNLMILDLSDMGLTGDIPDSLSELKKLRFLGLSRNNLTGNPSPELASLPFVSAIYLSGNNLSGDLKFSEEFYGKMGRRFGAWDNPNLCYPMGMVTANSAPYGVKPCEEEEEEVIKLTEKPFSNGNVAVSNGCSWVGVEGFWWKFVGKTLTMMLLIMRL
ncbi:Piriformospora indica-insensitive protein 2, partial [Cucurbita argyrosperma subsp. sororia]